MLIEKRNIDCCHFLCVASPEEFQVSGQLSYPVILVLLGVAFYLDFNCLHLFYFLLLFKIFPWEIIFNTGYQDKIITQKTFVGKSGAEYDVKDDFRQFVDYYGQMLKTKANVEK